MHFQYHNKLSVLLVLGILSALLLSSRIIIISSSSDVKTAGDLDVDDGWDKNSNNDYNNEKEYDDTNDDDEITGDDGTVCFNACSGHGHCINYSCHCWIGYHGGDCRETFITNIDGANNIDGNGNYKVLPILSAGHFNLTTKNFTQTIAKTVNIQQQSQKNKKTKRKDKDKDNDVNDVNDSKKDSNVFIKHLFIGFSSRLCDKCIQMEYEYDKVSDFMWSNRVFFGRANLGIKGIKEKVTRLTSQGIDNKHNGGDDILNIPSLVYFKNGKPYVYKGLQNNASIWGYVEKQIAVEPVEILSDIQSVYGFLNNNKNIMNRPLLHTVIIGFFTDPSIIEEDEYQEFINAAHVLQTTHDIFFGLVTDAKVCDYFKKEMKWIDRTPSMISQTNNMNFINIQNNYNTVPNTWSNNNNNDKDKDNNYNDMKAINLDELFEDGIDISVIDWIIDTALPLVGELNVMNFNRYEALGLPMLIMFLDLNEHRKHFSTTSSGTGFSDGYIYGRSNNIANQDLIVEFIAVAKEYSDKIAFVYADGNELEAQMTALGLFGGKERLPSIAFNSKDGRIVPFPETTPAINRETMGQFCADYISGKLKNANDAKEAAKSALIHVKNPSKVNTVERKARKKKIENVVGVSEDYSDIQGIVTINATNFDEIVLNEEKDVIIVFHKRGCEPCSHFAPYVRVAYQRYQELGVHSLVLAHMDVTDEGPPRDRMLILNGFPTMGCFPANNKNPPYAFYSGIGKPSDLMKWIQSASSIPFQLPNLPHLDEESKKLYIEQVTEREETRNKKLVEEEMAMKKEDERKRKWEKDNKKKNKKKKKKSNNNNNNNNNNDDEF